MNTPVNEFDFEHEGATFTARVYVDDSGDSPWDFEDGHGPVRSMRAWSMRYSGHKRPGERVLYRDGAYVLLYDWQAAAKLARADGWNAEPYDAPHRVSRAVQADFDRMRAYAKGDWCYVGVCVNLKDDEPSFEHAVWRIASDCPEYLREVAANLAGELVPA